MGRTDHLPDDIEVLKHMVLEREAVLHSQQLQIEQLRAMLARLRRMRFGRSSEQLDQQIEQLHARVFDQAELRNACDNAPRPVDFHVADRQRSEVLYLRG